MAQLQKTHPHRFWQHISSDIRKKVITNVFRQNEKLI
ncbi:hypothetical protein T11_18466 [Trichinella zimbabwensis]|uniref:Uncharacterized protein n=1 Tax=Trichinella zimbabwensis TaxID=268475 RepID=A0A0V1GA71_9BILA|nr:hypothetical protein T11_18466 [Trichinella zimbabwensis]